MTLCFPFWPRSSKRRSGSSRPRRHTLKRPGAALLCMERLEDRVLLSATRVSGPDLPMQMASATPGSSINFDSPDASGGAVEGAALDNYLAGYGITISNASSNIKPSVVHTG